MGAALAVGLALTGAQTASAVPVHTDSDIGTYTQRTVINKTSKHAYNKKDRLSYCDVSRTGATCTVSKSTTATRSIAVDLGITRSEVAGKLNISASSSVAISVSCTSPKLKKGERWSAYPNGTAFSYNIRSTTYRDTGVIISGPTTSGKLHAFSPDGGIHCM
ncbi:hypothetical protein DEJ00_08420 [Curtobacterium sp. MCLR17_039]|nr:hypothetical protein DEJ00_08420 [Curtobacterium sp. MCLR17_039]